MKASSKNRRSLPLLALLIMLAAASQAAGEEAHGRSTADLAMEDFLLHAEIVSIEDVGEGITEPQRLTLERDGETHRAIFKSIDRASRGAVRTAHDVSDRYAYEVAAYRLDRLAGIGLVPVTVVREVEGETGSVQLWIEKVVTLDKAIQDPSAHFDDFDLLVERLGLMHVLDALIYNVDRNFGNVLVDLNRDVFYPIDHSRSFRLSPKPLPSINDKTDELVVPAEVQSRLEAIDLETLEQLVGDLLEERQVRAIMKRCNRLVRMLDKHPA